MAPQPPKPARRAALLLPTGKKAQSAQGRGTARSAGKGARLAGGSRAGGGVCVSGGPWVGERLPSLAKVLWFAAVVRILQICFMRLSFRIGNGGGGGTQDEAFAGWEKKSIYSFSSRFPSPPSPVSSSPGLRSHVRPAVGVARSLPPSLAASPTPPFSVAVGGPPGSSFSNPLSAPNLRAASPVNRQLDLQQAAREQVSCRSPSNRSEWAFPGRVFKGKGDSDEKVTTQRSPALLDVGKIQSQGSFLFFSF